MKARLIFLLSIKIVIISIFFACSSSPKETEKTSSLCYRSAFYVADDGWVYEFDNQYRSDVPMKDSGIEWIGMIPEHWGVAKLANLFNRRACAERSHWTLTIPGYSADRAFATEVSLSPSVVIAISEELLPTHPKRQGPD